MQPRNEPKQRQQAGQKSTIYLILFVFAAMIISTLSIDSKADENDWFVYLGTQEAKKSLRRNINAAGLKSGQIGGHLTYFSLSLKGIKGVRLPYRRYIYR